MTKNKKQNTGLNIVVQLGILLFSAIILLIKLSPYVSGSKAQTTEQITRDTVFPTSLNTSSVLNSEENKVYYTVDKKASFVDGEKALNNYIKKNFKYPKSYKNSFIGEKIFVLFVVSSNGNLEQIKVQKGVNPQIDKEVIKLVQSMPSWIPAKLKGKNVASWYTLAITL